jgi:hypothetical protein
MTAQNCTAANVKPVVAEIKVAVNVAIDHCKALVGVGLDVALSTSVGVLAIVDVAKIVASVICVSISVYLNFDLTEEICS